MPPAAHGRHARVGNGRRWARRILIGANIFVALALVAAGSTAGYAIWQLNQIKRVAVPHLVQAGKTKQSPASPTSSLPAMTILIVGSDTRAGLDQPGDAQYGSAAAITGARSDTIILARVVPATDSILLLSIPRDTYVDIPGMGDQKINAALGSGPDLLVQVIEQQFGIDVNHFIDVDFDSFKDISDAIGGVELYFPTPVRDPNAGLSIPAAGCVNLEGATALAFVRSREYTYYENGVWTQEGLSDLARIYRQQIFVRLLAQKAESDGITNPITLNGIISGITQNLTVDTGLSNSLLLQLAETFRSINPSSIQGWTLPTDAETLYPDGQADDVLIPDKAEDAAMVQQFLAYGAAPATPATTTTTTVAAKSKPKTAKSTTTTSTTTTTTVSPASVQVQVVNGSGVSGQATKAGASLKADGFDVTTISSASTYDATANVIQYGTGGLGAAQSLEAYVGGGATLEADSDLNASTVVLTTGSAFTGIVAPSGSTSATTGGTTTTTTPGTSATTSTTVYQLPGTPPGGNPSCPN